MFEPTNIAAEIIALTALGNSTVTGLQDKIKPSEFKHVSVAGVDEYPFNGNPSTISGPRIPTGSCFLLTHFSMYVAAEPPVNGDLSVVFGLAYNSISVRVFAVEIDSSSQIQKSSALGVQSILNRPVIFVFPENTIPQIAFTPSADPRTALSIELYGNLHGYFLPSARGNIFRQFETQLKTEGT